ncbi:uncharacterized protein LOC134180539 [Corticium candelabrum]|uniref:uncharacterized protein LOC134180539 n=1 Tax=Corticium candelabrum TaxID=121492 RepID=UPI002E25E012|nr:uncharacterized protein LOC134180539 [Corticium candelabrum]
MWSLLVTLILCCGTLISHGDKVSWIPSTTKLSASYRTRQERSLPKKLSSNKGSSKDSAALSLLTCQRQLARLSIAMHSSIRYNSNACSRTSYRVTLRYGRCRRQVETKLCYGMCTSYSRLISETFVISAMRLRDLERVERGCSYCTHVGNISIRKYHVNCIVNGRYTRKLFYIPWIESCRCRPCLTI